MIRLTLDAAWRRMDKIPKFQEKINSAGRGRAASSRTVVLGVAFDDETRGRKRRVSVGGLRRIDVDHDVFDNWKLFLNRFVNVSRDGMRLASEFATPADHMKLIKAVRELIAALPGLAETYRKLRHIQRLYPDCPAGYAIDSVLAAGDEAWVLDTDAALAELRAFLEKGPRAD